MANRVEIGRPVAERPGGLLGLASDYLTLTKPPIISLLLITATGGMFLAAEGIRMEKISMRYMAAELESWPASCGSEARRSEKQGGSPVEPIRDRLEKIPTLLAIDKCAADLLERAAHQVVHAQLNGEAGERMRALGIPVRTVHHELTP